MLPGMADYLTKKIVGAKCVRTAPGAGMTREGYTKRSGAPSSTMIKLAGESRWRRVMIWQFSNAGTSFVRIKGKPYIIPQHDIPECK